VNFYNDNLHTVSSLSKSARVAMFPWVREIPPESSFFTGQDVEAILAASPPVDLENADYYFRFLDNFGQFASTWGNDLESAPYSWLGYEFTWRSGDEIRFIDHGLMFSDLLLLVRALLPLMDKENRDEAAKILIKYELGEFLLSSESKPDQIDAVSKSVDALESDSGGNYLKTYSERSIQIERKILSLKLSQDFSDLMARYLLERVVLATQPLESADELIWYEVNFGPMETYRYTAAFESKFENSIYSNEWMPKRSVKQPNS